MGPPIRNFGQTTVPFRDGEGRPSTLHFQVADVTQPLVSVAGLVDAGSVVIFDDKGGWIIDKKTRRRNRLARHNNTFSLDMEVPIVPQEEGGRGRGDDIRPVFARQERK